MPGEKTFFNISWTNSELHPDWSKWLKPVKNVPNSAFCTKCNKTFSLSNMGVQAIKSHEQGKSHQKLVKHKPLVFNVKVTEISTDLSEDPVTTSSSFAPSSSSSAPSSNSSAPRVQKTLDELAIKKETTVAEILWALRIIMKNSSFNSCKDDGFLFKKMFPDSTIAENFSMGPDKASYLINYGLAPYFNSLLQKQLLGCEKFVICFDEAMNKIAQKGQMDLHIRFWCDVKQQVCTRYLNSSFLTKSCAENLLESFKQALSPLSLDKLLQVSMDGPAVNWKFLQLLNSEIELEENREPLLNIGSCGLHVIHGAFQTGHKKAGWKVNQFLRSLYYLFKDSPARRAEYTDVTGSSTFPRKFCQVRWLENAQCAERAILIFENVHKFIKEKKLPDTVSAKNVQNCLSNPLMLPQLAFFKMLADEIYPFLQKFQTSEPLSPFIYSSLMELTLNLLRRFIKKEIVNDATTARKIASIDLKNDDNLLTFHHVDIGFSASKYLNKSKISEKDKKMFRLECRTFLTATVYKILERSPLRYNLTRGISCLMPNLLVTSQSEAQKRMDLCLKTFYDKNILTEIAAEKTKKEFAAFCDFSRRENKQNFLDFVPSSEKRLDTFYSQQLKDIKRFENLFNTVKLILIMSHGNATVESGFSINKGLLLENLKEESIVCQRHVHQYVSSSGGLQQINIDGKMVLAVKGARSRWNTALEEKKKQMAEAEKAILSQKRQLTKIKELKAKKVKLSKTSALEIDLLNSEIAKEEDILKNISI